MQSFVKITRKRIACDVLDDIPCGRKRVLESKQKLLLFASAVTGMVATESRQVRELKARIRPP